MRIMMKKIYTLLTALLLLALSSCSRQADNIQELNSTDFDGTITLTTHAPEWDTATKALLSENEGSLGLTASFKPTDKVRLFIVQEGQLYDLKDVAFSSVSSDGQVAQLTITLPEGVDASRPVDIIGYNGLNQRYITMVNGEPLVSIKAFNHTALDKFSAPVYFRLKGITPSTEAITDMKVKFEHLGAYEIVHFENKSADPIKARVTLSEVSSYGPKKSWGYADEYVSGQGFIYSVYNIITGEVKTTTQRISQEFYYEPDINPGEKASVISWVFPRPGITIPQSVLDYYDNKTRKNFQSKGMIPAQSFGMEVGKVYHTYGYWDGQNVVALDPSNNERPTPFVRVTTNKEVGDNIKFKTYVSYSANSTAWVDYNNNNVKDGIEEDAPRNFKETQVALKSQTFTFHGGFESITIAGQGLTKVEVSPVASIVELDVSENQLSADALDALFAQLPDINHIEASVLKPKTLKINKNPGVDTCNPKVAIRKGWILDVTLIDETQPHMYLSLGSYGSKDLYFYIDAPEADREGIWVDLNGDAEKQENEAITKFGGTKLHKYTAQSGDVIFYGNITKLDVISANLFAYYGGTNKALKYFNLSGTGIVAAIMQGHPNIEFLNLSGNQLRTDVLPLHLATLTKLKVLDLGNCQAGNMDFSNNTALRYLNVEGNKMSTLDVTKLTNLTQLICSSNSLKSLDIGGAKGLFHLEATLNGLSDAQVNGIINALPDRVGKSEGGLWIAGNPGTGSGDFHIAKGKNWTVDARNSKSDNKLRRPIMEGEDW